MDYNDNFRVVQGDIIHDPSNILVCPVNCVPGVMGKGLAKQFADTHPGLQRDHDFACQTGGLRIREPRLVMGGIHGWRHDVILFPTKGHWRNPSNPEWIFSGLVNLSRMLNENNTGDGLPITIAMPALGCGLGGLGFDLIGPMIAVWAGTLSSRFSVTLYHTHEGQP